MRIAFESVKKNRSKSVKIVIGASVASSRLDVITARSSFKLTDLLCSLTRRHDARSAM